MPKILAIDDINDNLISLKAIVHDAFPGSVVFTALNGPEGIKLAIANDPDVILLDVIMPEMDGFEVCRQLKELERVCDIPVVFVTAIKGDKESRIKALEVGAEGFLSKPIDEIELTAQIRAMLKIKASNEHKRDENDLLVKMVEERTRELQNELDEHRKTEEALKESEERFRDIFNISPDSVAISEVETGKYVEVSPSFEKLSGYSREEIIGRTSIGLGFWVEIEHREDYIGRLKKYGEINDLEINFKNKKGAIVHTIVSTRLIFNSGKSLVLSVIKDITERKLAEKKLQESESQFREFFEKAADAIFIAEMESGIIVDANESASRLMLMSKDQMIGLHQTQLHPPVNEKLSKETFVQHKVAIDENISPVLFENSVLRSDGVLVPVEILAAEVVFQGKQCLLGTFRDISERKHAEQSLWESQLNFKALFEKGPIGVAYHRMIYDETGKPIDYLFLDANQSYQNLTGINPIGKLVTEAFPGIENDLFDWIGAFGEVAKTGKEIRFQQYLQANERWYDCVGYQYKPDHFVAAFFEITEKKTSEIALRESNELNNSLLQTIPFGMDIVDEQGNILFQNKIFENIFGKKAIGCKCWEIYRDDKCQCIDCPLVSGIQIGETSIYETHGVKDGKTFEISHTGMMFQGKKAMLEIFQDITERKQSEKTLKESEERYRSFISQVSEGVYRFESDQPMDLSLTLEEQVDFIYDHMFIAECNEALLKLYGISDQNEMIGKGHLDFHQDRYHPVNREVMRRFVRNGYRIEDEITEEFDIAKQIKFFSNNSLGIVENNLLVRMWGTQVNITEKIKAERVQQVLYAISNAALSEIDLAELIGFISDQIGKLLDSTNFYIAFYDEVSGMLSTHFEKDEKDLINNWPAEKSITGYVVRNQKSLLAHAADVLRLIESGEIDMIGTPSEVWLGVPLLVNRKVIGAIVVQSYTNPEAYTENEKLMLEFVSHQISISIERKMAQQEIKESLAKAQESDRLKSAFLANMSHEIRTPLNSIIGFSELIADPDFNVEQQIDFARMINESGTNLLMVITDIMDISKIEAGQVHARMAHFSANHLIGDIQKEYSYKASKNGIELRLDPSNPKDEIVIESDEIKLRQVLVNLVSNAVKFTQRGFVEVGMRLMDDQIQFHVKDTGIGIHEEHHHHIFERFKQVESSDTRRYGGNGLGLAISKSLVELLGGNIWMESETGKGSTFYFSIPIKD